MFFCVLILLVISYLNPCEDSEILEEYEPKWLTLDGDKWSERDESYFNNKEVPTVYCYKGLSTSILNTWMSATAYVDLSRDVYDLYEGETPQKVWAQFESPQSSWRLNPMTFQDDGIQLNPFKDSCFGIRANEEYFLNIQVDHFDIYLVAIFSAGVILFLFSSLIAGYPLFHYLSGIVIGLLTSLLILSYFFLRLLPLRKPAILGVMAGGTTIGYVAFRTMFGSILLILSTYHEYVLAYVAFSALISFIFCYRFGPVTDPRGINLIKWALQATALGLIYLSSHQKKTVTSINAVLIVLGYTPIISWIVKLLMFGGRIIIPGREKQRPTREEEKEVLGQQVVALPRRVVIPNGIIKKKKIRSRRTRSVTFNLIAEEHSAGWAGDSAELGAKMEKEYMTDDDSN